MHTEDFDYDLPSLRIAQEPVEPRDRCGRASKQNRAGQIDHRVFSDLPEYLREGDLLVVNETRVLPARLKGVKEETGGAVEVLLLREHYEGTWECLVKPGRRLKPGARMVFGDGELIALVVGVLEDSGGRLVRFRTEGMSFLDAVHRIGEVPLPPYVTKELGDPEQYQTVYAAEERSAAAPTAGLHFTPELLQNAEDAGAGIARIELDVGLDTFRPVAEDDPRDHRMHSEHFRVSDQAAEQVNTVRAAGGRVICIGTTTVRALESAFDESQGAVVASERASELSILPGHRFSTLDVLITNFHIPRSTLLMLVSAFAGRELIMHAYETALEERYRFLSFGDAMLIL